MLDAFLAIVMLIDTSKMFLRLHACMRAHVCRAVTQCARAVAAVFSRGSHKHAELFSAWDHFEHKTATLRVDNADSMVRMYKN
jgi:peptidyl-tRNA hydrolase